MSNPIGTLSDRLAQGPSRRGFLVTLGKGAIVASAALAGLGAHEVDAASSCISYTPQCTSGCTGTQTYLGCCGTTCNLYEIYKCVHSDGAICYTLAAVGCACPSKPSLQGAVV